jgi:hypothetical protein
MKAIFAGLLFVSIASAQMIFNGAPGFSVPNDPTVGTTLNGTAIIGSTGAIGATTTAAQQIYIVVDNAGTTGSATLAYSGIAKCTFDTSVPNAANYFVIESPSFNGQCHAQPTAPTSGWVIGFLYDSLTTIGQTSRVIVSPFPISGVGSIPVPLMVGGTSFIGFTEDPFCAINSPLDILCDLNVGGGNSELVFNANGANQILAYTNVPQGFTALQTFIAGLTATGPINANGGLSTTTLSATGPVTASAGITTTTLGTTGPGAGGNAETQGAVPNLAASPNSIIVNGAPNSVTSPYFQYWPGAPGTGLFLGTASAAATFGTCVFSAGAVTSCPVSSGGTYGETPGCWLTGGGGTGALCTFTMSGTAIATVVISPGGVAYTSAPTVNATKEVAVSQVPLPISGAVTAADVTCGTGGTISSCASATTIPGLSFTLPLLATNWTMDCDLVVGQATAATANQWLIQTATNGVTNTTASYTMATAATAAMAVGAVTDQASTTTAFQISPSWTLGGTATKMPVHIHALLEGVSVSGTVVNLQVLAPTVADLLTIYRGASCSLHQ